MYRHRRIDIWLLLSVAALMARFWARHRWYDDLLLLLPMVALFRAATSGNARAGLLFALMIPATIAPGGQYLFPEPWNWIYQIAQVGLWLAAAVFLVAEAAQAASHRTRLQVP
jgi:hypothetical protein